MLKSYCEFPILLQGTESNQSGAKCTQHAEIFEKNFKNLLSGIPGKNNNF